MNRELLLVVQPQHLVNILNGDKTFELRKLLPKNFDELVKKYGGIWVNLYCTKGGEGLYFDYLGRDWFLYGKGNASNKIIHNGKVVARFWFDDYDVLDWWGSKYLSISKKHAKENETIGDYTNRLFKQLCLTPIEIKKYLKWKTGYAWHIKNLEIFDTPKELSDFYYFRTETVYCGMDCPPYVDEVKHTLRKAPQSFRYVYVKGEE